MSTSATAATTRPTTTTLYDSQGRPLRLGKELGRGGEGAVYLLHGRPELVAKLYHEPPAPTKAAKLATMVRKRSERLLRLAAWPVETAHDGRGGPVIGLLMPKITGYQPIHELYTPKSRLAHFPDADWRFLVHASANTARAFAVIHEHGHVIGDVNHGNVVVSREATVKLIDCDSFQVTDGWQRYLCEVGVPTHTPPELQGVRLDSVVRTPNHDAFGLAVIIFQLLFMGRHPFAGRYPTQGEAPSLEQAISQHWFTFSSRAPAQHLLPPPASLSLSAISAPVALLFERAFGPESMRDDARPTPREWIDSLTDLGRSLWRCGRNPSHSYPRGLAACPWCEIETRTGLLLFKSSGGPPLRQPPRSSFDIDAVWRQILAVPAPGPAPLLPSKATIALAPSPAVAALRQARRWHMALTVLIFIGLMAGALLAIRYQPRLAGWLIMGAIGVTWHMMARANGGPRRAAERMLAEAGSRWRQIEDRWQREAGEDAFQAKLRELEAKQRSYRSLPQLRQARLDALVTMRRERQLKRYLDQFRIERANIPGFGPGRKATLESYGIETAADITETTILRVPGFGPTYARRLLKWRRGIESRFVYNPNAPDDPADIAAIEQEIVVTRGRLEMELLQGAAELRQLREQVVAARQTLWPVAQETLADLVQAETNLRAL